MNPNRAELELFALGGENAERLAVLSYAKRVGVAPQDARQRLKTILAAPVPEAWREVRS